MTVEEHRSDERNRRQDSRGILFRMEENQFGRIEEYTCRKESRGILFRRVTKVKSQAECMYYTLEEYSPNQWVSTYFERE